MSNPIKYWDTWGLKSGSPGCNKCGPDMTGFLTSLIRDTFRWRGSQIEEGLWGNFWRGKKWLQNNAPKLVYGSSLKKNEGILYNTDNCPTEPICANTVTLCDECVHDRWIGNFMFALLARLVNVPDIVANYGAQNAQKKSDRASDPPWDTAAYKIARNNMERLKNLADGQLCILLKGKIDLWNQANNTFAAPPVVNYSPPEYPPLYVPTAKYPAPINTGNYREECEPCKEKPTNTTLPGGGFEGGWPELKY